MGTRAKLSFINNTLFYWKAHKSYLTKEALCSVDINTGNENWKIKSRQGSQFNIISDSTIAIEDSYSDWISETEEADFGIITVYNSKTGKMLWKMDLLNTRIKNSPDYSVIAISNNKIITKRNDTLFTFNGNTGKQIWSKKMDALSFKSNGNNLYASNNDNVVCIDFDGNQKWVFNFDKQEKKAKRIYQLVENNMIYIENGSTYLLNSVTGDLLWKKDTILSATNRSTYKKYPIILASNLTLIQTDKNTIKAYDNVDGAEKWIYKRNNSIYLDKNIYNGTLFISSGQGLLMACNNSDKAKSKIQTTAQGIDLYQYETIQFSSVNLPTNGKWMINTADKATAGAREFVVSEGSYGNIIRSLNWGSWKANIEDTDAAILAVKASTGDLIRYNDYHFRSTGEDVKIPVPVFTTKLVTLENGTKAVLVEAEIKITKPVTSRIFGNSYYARLYYFITDGEGEKTKFPVIASSAMFKAENYEKEKKEFQELIDYIANTAVLK